MHVPNEMNECIWEDSEIGIDKLYFDWEIKEVFNIMFAFQFRLDLFELESLINSSKCLY